MEWSICEWLKRKDVGEIWKAYVNPLKDTLPSLRDGFQEKGLSFSQMEKYGEDSQAYTGSALRRHWRVVEALKFMIEHGDSEEEAVSKLTRWSTELFNGKYNFLADACTAFTGNKQSGGKRRACSDASAERQASAYKKRKEDLEKKIVEEYNVVLS